MSRENRKKVVLFLLGILFPVIGGILTGYIEDCGVLLLLGCIVGMTFCLAWAFKEVFPALLLAITLCPAIFFWLNPHAFDSKEEKELEKEVDLLRMKIEEIQQREQARDNWNRFIARYVENRSWLTGMFTEDGINATIAESRQREFEMERNKPKHEANGGRERNQKPWWRPLLCLVGGLLYGSLKKIMAH